MRQALLRGLVQSGLPVHQLCAVKPAGYPRISYLLPKRFCLHQCISGYLIFNKSRWYVVTRKIVVQTFPSAVGILLSRHTLFDTLVTTKREVNFHAHRLQGE